MARIALALIGILACMVLALMLAFIGAITEIFERILRLTLGAA